MLGQGPQIPDLGGGAMTELVLPYPPSANRYWRHPTKGRLAGRHLISREGRAYRSHVGWLVQSGEPLTGRVHLRLTVCPPDRRKRDIDNVLKASLDALTHAGVWVDDSQIDRLLVTRGEVVKGGSLIAQIAQLEVT